MGQAILYCRVSTKQQTDGISLEEQERRCRQHATHQGHVILDVVQEVASAGSLRGRPVLLDVRRRLREGDADVLIAFNVDRLTRSQVHMGVLLNEMRENKTKLEFADGVFEDSPIGRFVLSALAMSAEIERERIIERSIMGRLGRVKRGKMLVSGRGPLYGYRWADTEKSRYEPDPATAPIVQRIFAEAAAGKPTRRIALELNEAGIPTSSGEGVWQFGSVSNLLNHEGYIGTARVMRREFTKIDGKTTMTYRPLEETTVLPEGTIPPIVDRETWDRVRTRAERNRTSMTRAGDRGDALLRGAFIRCGGCGCRMAVTRKANGTPQYRCHTHARDKRRCQWVSIKAETLDLAVWSRIETVLRYPERLERLLAVPERSPVNEVAALDAQLEGLDSRVERLVQRLSEIDSDDGAADAVLAGIRSLNAQRMALAETRTRSAEEAENAEARARRVDATIASVRALTDRIETLAYDEKRQIMLDIGLVVEVYPKGHESGEHWVMVAMWREEGRTKLITAGETRRVPLSSLDP